MFLKKLLFCYLFLSLQLCIVAQEQTLLTEQKKIVAQLSGYESLAEGGFIASRSTKEQREQTRVYLENLFTTNGLQAERQNYSMPNVNPLVDLLINPFKGANVFTILPATQSSDNYVVVGAHFDTERNCPGAIDNATGIAISFTAIKRLASLQNRKVNVILVYFDQEEEELVGSKAFAQKLIKEDYNVLSVHSLDTMGWDGDDDRAVELGLATKYLDELYQSKAAALGIKVHLTNVVASDHESFYDLGFNAIGLTDELVNGDFAPYKDTPKDTYDTVNFDYVTSTTELLYQVLKHIVQE